MDTETNSPAELAAWVVKGMLPDSEVARAGEIARRVEGIIRAERAVDSNAPNPAELRPNTLKELRQTAIMIRKWVPEAFPANEDGKVHFVRAVMESVATVIEQALVEYGVDAGLVAMERRKAASELHAAGAEIDRLSLVIESAVRNADPSQHSAVLAALMANRAAVEKSKPSAQKASP